MHKTYVKANFRQLLEQQFYVARKRDDVTDKFKIKKLDKFAKKFIVLLYSCSLKSNAFVSCSTINQHIYIKKCLEKRVLSLVCNHMIFVMFWSNLATAHDTKTTLDLYLHSGVKIVSRVSNLPNCLKLLNLYSDIGQLSNAS